jgi:ferredoxin-type protein NapG
MSSQAPMNRRNFLRGRIVGGVGGVLDGIADRLSEVTSQSVEPQAGSPSERYCKSFPILRPPGAIAEDAFLEGCTRCDACVEACPHGSIVHAPARFRRAAGTPMIDPAQQPCWMCEDTPCVHACEPRVLRSELPVKIGLARIDVTMCMAHQGSFCTVCSEQCPVAGAIELVNGRPRIVEDACTGCGVCQHVCPAPGNAILLMPLPARPVPPETGEPADA